MIVGYEIMFFIDNRKPVRVFMNILSSISQERSEEENL